MAIFTISLHPDIKISYLIAIISTILPANIPGESAMARKEDDDFDDRDDDDVAVKKSSKKSKDGKYSDDERMWAMFAHLGIFVAGFIAPLVIWQMKKDESAFVTKNAKASLNFCITWSVIAMFTCGLGVIPLYIFAIIAGIAANRGEVYKYPMTLTLIS
jgi:uncharacterized Tic20 family protein